MLSIRKADHQRCYTVVGVSKPRPPRRQPTPELSEHLGYLFKHVHLRLSELTSAALAPIGISGRELAVLLVLDGREPASQQQAATRLGVDRTTMVGLLDGLADKDLITRHPHEQDRRRNVVELTARGKTTLRAATAASAEAQRRFLAPLGVQAAQQFTAALVVLLAPED
jgi:DNA-binding MarR family transcriptional regulator